MRFAHYSYRPYPICHTQNPNDMVYSSFPVSRYRQEETEYPEIDPNQLLQSANTFQNLMDEADKIVNAFSDSKEFCYKVIDAAQKNEKDKVEQYIKSTGIEQPISISYNPDGIHLTLSDVTNDIECCELSIALHW
ncbi:hypothetical protein NC797_00215 [Aquibacillus sp. 3ASR75-11]|uniref:Uncharacterized protein n=1 Tax=Terrihalobacillus insolitus TaxID=2950438 RepID=A0A9X3WQM8_9BACI|nr:hypothetical protein [Terrihalobacillus insolitus]MDC3412379.1 hypothetical protein [Terrihalobacillus insolitus]MDC3422928.1 hypothetical protein [Terrihalobacillus insolitus]